MSLLTAQSPDATRTCTRCGTSAKVKDFPHCIARGKMTVRSWCSVCLKRYYSEHSKQARIRSQKEYRVARRGDNWLVMGRKHVYWRVLATCATEQEAERLMREWSSHKSGCTSTA